MVLGTYRGGLSHLVEAATVLSGMVDAEAGTAATTRSEGCQPQHGKHNNTNGADTSTQPPQPAPTKTIVSDDDNEDLRRPTPQRKIQSGSHRDRQIFPQRLHALLNQPSLSEVVSWLPHGRSFVIMKPDVFAIQVLPKFFPSNDSRIPTKYPSFTRKLNRWGFRQATRGPDSGAFHHPLFRRDQPGLCKDMICQKGSRKRRSNNGGSRSSYRSQPSSTPASKSISLFASGAVTLVPEALQMLRTSSTQTHSSGPVVSVGDRLSGTASSAAVAPDSRMFTCVVPTDPSLVTSALKLRDEREKLRVYKSLLYDAYVKALKDDP